MALSNWLTRNEWNAAYFAGMGAIIDASKSGNLGEQMRLGIAAMVKAGYRFHGIAADAEGNYEKRTQCCGGNETVLAEMLGAYGGFDAVGRGREAIDFAKREIPQLDFAWLEEAIATKQEA